MRHRPEIDGLRAVAVVPVLLFHANAALVPGGFLGVDIFFVISGFLITALLIEDLAAGTYTLARFYERRARRILPALIVMVLATAALGWLTMLPRAFGNLARSAAATAAFLSNVFFWQTTNYFDIDAIAQPLLHTWSLAVEEQFYLAFPLLLTVLWRLKSPRVTLGALLLLLLASLAFAQWGTHLNAKVNYYFTPSRLWELVMGAVGAVAVHLRGRRPHAGLAGLGTLAILTSMAMFGQNTPHPGLLTLVPTLGTLAVLLCGGATGPAGWLLTRPLVILVGQISYSLYLWHYPVFSFAAVLGPVSAEPWHLTLQIAVIVAVSTLSWRYVERPFRTRQPGRGPGPALWGAAVTIALVVAAGQGLGTFPKLTLRYLAANPQDRAMLMFAETHRPADPGAAGTYLCFFHEPRDISRAGHCVPPAHPNLVLWGDSHAASLAVGFALTGTVTGMFVGPGCGPMLDDGWSLSGECAAENARVMQELRRTPPDTLVLHAYWRSKRDQMRLLPQTLAQLRRDLPQTRIVVLGGMPYWLPSLPERIVTTGTVGQFDARIPAQMSGVRAADDRLAQVFAAAIASGEVTFIRPTDLICTGDLCPAYAGTTPYAQDYGHLTDVGAVDMVRRLQARYPTIFTAP